MSTLRTTLFLLFLVSHSCYSQLTTNLPIVLIETSGQTITDEPGVIIDFKIINNSSGVNNSSDPPTDFNGKAKIEFRGCSSQNFPKKSYAVELRNSTNTSENIDASLLGFPEESDWVLNASYTDKNFLRETVAFELAKLAGRYASRTQHVEVILNGQYQGLYVFEEKIKRGNDRVAIKKLENIDTELPKISGGYILKIDKSCGNTDPAWTSAYDSPNANPGRRHGWAIDYPNSNNINTQQFNYIKSSVENFENVLNGPNVCDPVTGYSSVLDVASFVDFILFQEVAYSADAYRFSTYFSKNRNEKIAAGPIWDFNLALGFFLTPTTGNSFNYQGWRYSENGDPNFPVPFFWSKLLNCPSFKTALVNRYKALRNSVWKTADLMTFIDTKYEYVNNNDAYERNFEKWQTLNTQIWTDTPTYVGGSVEAEVGYLKGWLTNRLDWMDKQIATVSNAALPVTLVSFTAKNFEDAVQLEWMTSAESNSSLFAVERSKDSRQFEYLGQINSIGDATELTRYQFVDDHPLNGIAYYRLKQVDADGKYAYSTVRAIDHENLEEIFISPNPASEKINLSVGKTWSVEHYQLFDVTGRLLRSGPIGKNEDRAVSIDKLNAGTYFLHFLTGKERKKTLKFIKE